ncbi:hypothetical protein ANO14919_022620 [Xylariales sp. No.14919]|nr:hypothetical protein ANO14919_022620 [Xylariales sp. No.14919]
MAHTIQTPRTSSPPADLRPAPLRIPLRKSVASFDRDDDPEPPRVTKHSNGARDAPASTLSRNDLSLHSHPAIPHTFAERHDPGSKLESLVSRFEILDAVNSVDISIPQHLNHSHRARPSALPRATGSKQPLHRNTISHSPRESISRTSSELSPRQLRTPVSFGRKSTLPVSTQPIANVPNAIGCGHSGVDHARSPFAPSIIPVLRHSRSFITSKKTPPRRLPTSKSFRKNHPSPTPSSSASATSTQATPELSLSRSVPKRRGTPRRLRTDSNLPAGPGTLPPQPRLSVADLRESFEKISQPAETFGGSTRLSFHSKSSRRSVGQGQNMLSSDSKRPQELRIEWSSIAPDEASSSRRPLFGKGHIVHVRSWAKAAELPSIESALGVSVRHDPSAFLSRGGRSSPQEIRQEDGKIVSVPLGLDPASRRVNGKMGRQSGTNAGLDTSMDGVGGASSNEKKGDRSLVEPPNVQHEPSAAADASGRGQLEPLKIPLALSSGDRPTQGCGKVSQLRSFFERSSKRLSSPLSFVNFRSRLESEESIDELTRDYSSSSWNESECPTSTHTIARKISIVPSLTTEISVNDFFCDFVGPSHEENSINASPSETPAEMEPQTKRESPVKRRIQQFEHLSRDSLRVGASTEHHGRYNDVGLPSTLENENRAGGKRNTVAGWRPIHRKGVAIWRKISSSFSRSLDSWKDCNGDREPVNLTENTNSNGSPDRSPLPASNSGLSFRRPSPFGYSMYRVPHKSRRPAISSNTTSSIQIGGGDSPYNVPKKGLNTSYSRLSLDTPPSLAVRKSPPFIARMTSGLHLPGGFGLDGHFPSKPVEEEEEFRPSEATTSELSTPQGDPNALLKVMLKQSAEERSRRRQDEKHLRRDKTFKTLARWKEKCKVDVAHHFTDDTEESAKKHDKGKGKGKERETARGESEGQCEQDTETNKKTESGFVVFESKHVKLRHPKPRRPGQGRKLANMYRDKGSSGVSVTTKASSGATLKDSRQGFRQKASSALGLGTRKRNST